MKEFQIEQSWLPRGSASDPLVSSYCSLAIEINGRNVTEYTAIEEEDSDHLELPAYHLAEWIAENWWAILWEPRKNEDSGPDSNDFLSRHSILTAQCGFILPQITIVSNGAYLNLSANARNVPSSDIKFIYSASSLVHKEQASHELAQFVQATFDRLESTGISGTHLQACWQAVLDTPKEAVDYCEMVGALGLSPYANLPTIDRILDGLDTALGPGITRDLCLVGQPQELETTARIAKLAVSSAHSAPEIEIKTLASLDGPPENPATPAWQRGRRAAQIVRERYAISEANTSGADIIFGSLGLDPSKRASIGAKDFQPEGAAIVGAALRYETTAQISFIQRHENQRRFAAARGLFSAWTSKARQGHLLTQAVTRQQQASRAFAAELLAPFEYIRRFATKSIISIRDIEQIARDLIVSADVVEKQAENNGLRVSRSR